MLDIKCGELGQDTPDIEEHHANLKENTRTVAEIICMQKVRDMHWKPPCTTHTVEVLFIGLNFYTEDPGGVGDTRNISLLQKLFLTNGS